MKKYQWTEVGPNGVVPDHSTYIICYAPEYLEEGMVIAYYDDVDGTIKFNSVDIQEYVTHWIIAPKSPNQP